LPTEGGDRAPGGVANGIVIHSQGPVYECPTGLTPGLKLVATLPKGQEYGTGSAAALASQVKKIFPNVWFG
jgi:hypothetical protein